MGLTITADDIRRVKESLCKSSFRDFILRVRPGYVFNWHHEILIQALQDLADRKIMRLVVMMPPRHGKSELVSRLFPAWILARNPDEQIISCSYSASLAGKMSRDCQKIMASAQYAHIFQNTRLGSGTNKEVGVVRTNQRFDVVGYRGYYVSAGVGGGITGEGCTVGIIDDPVKNAAEADSETYRENAWDWYTTTFRTRFEPDCIEVICQTRWHEDDLTGRILQQDKGITVIDFPAICETKEEHRKPGDALWESKYNVSELTEIRQTVGSRAWNALYQQRPAAQEGNEFKKAWFNYYDKRAFELRPGEKVNFYFDTAYTDDESNDPMGCTAYVKRGADYYFLNISEIWVEFPEQTAHIKKYVAQNGYTSSSIVRIEPKASGKSQVQVLKRDTGLNVTDGRVPKESKLARARSVQSIVEGGRCYLPLNEGWVPDFITQITSFPNAKHDDMVDVFTGAIISEGGIFTIHGTAR